MFNACTVSSLELTVTQLSANFEARQTFQTVQGLASKEANRLEHSELSCPVSSQPSSTCARPKTKSWTTQTIDPSALRVYSEIYATESCSIQVGMYNGKTVVVRKYYTANETVSMSLLLSRYWS